VATTDPLSLALPLDALDRAAARAVRVIATDVDGTLTTGPHMPAVAYDALWRAHDAGLHVVAVTGRSAGYGDTLARLWPIDAAVAETGAVAMGRGRAGAWRRWAEPDPARRAENRRRLDAIGAAALDAFPGTKLASDQPYREQDLAIDVAEEVPPLPPDDVERLLAFVRAQGCTASVSSVHVNAWLGAFDKADLLADVAADVLGVPREAQADAVLVVGDSLNDQAMFRAFPLSVGVANVAHVRDRLVHAPRYVTRAEGGEGFAELVAHLLAARAAP
jgi:HAD superfamily hydrolase (TIGR01484 family)